MPVYNVRLQTNGGSTVMLEVKAQSQREAHQIAEARQPGYKAKGSRMISAK